MKNFVQAGSQVTVPAPAAVSSGAGVLIGALFGIANGDAASGADVALTLTGVFDMPKATGALATGAVVYWDNVNKRVTATATDNTRIGIAVAAAGSGAATARVRLNGSF